MWSCFAIWFLSVNDNSSLLRAKVSVVEVKTLVFISKTSTFVAPAFCSKYKFTWIRHLTSYLQLLHWKKSVNYSLSTAIWLQFHKSYSQWRSSVNDTNDCRQNWFADKLHFVSTFISACRSQKWYKLLFSAVINSK